MKLLIPIDDSDYAFKALNEGLRFAKLCNAEAAILTVSPYLGAIEDAPPSFEEKLDADAADLIERAKAEATKQGMDAECLVKKGISPAEIILEQATEKKVDLIVMGHRGKTGLIKFLMGSVAQQVVAHSPCSVLIVK